MATKLSRKPQQRRAPKRPVTRVVARKPGTDSVTVDGAVEECYRAWRDPEQIPRFLSFVQTVRDHGPAQARWAARDVNGKELHWDMERVEDIPGERIRWR